MVTNRLTRARDYLSQPSAPSHGVASDLVRSVLAQIPSHLLGTHSSGIDITVEVDQYRTTTPEGKYTEGVYSKLTVVGLQKEKEQLAVSEDELIDVVQTHLTRLNEEVLLLRERIKKSFERMDAMERRTNK